MCFYQTLNNCCGTGKGLDIWFLLTVTFTLLQEAELFEMMLQLPFEQMSLVFKWIQNRWKRCLWRAIPLVTFCTCSKVSIAIVYWVSCTLACKALWEMCEYVADWKCALFSESVIRNHRGPVWDADTPLTTRIKLTRFPSDMAGNNIQPMIFRDQNRNWASDGVFGGFTYFAEGKANLQNPARNLREANYCIGPVVLFPMMVKPVNISKFQFDPERSSV